MPINIMESFQIWLDGHMLNKHLLFIMSSNLVSDLVQNLFKFIDVYIFTRSYFYYNFATLFRLIPL